MAKGRKAARAHVTAIACSEIVSSPLDSLGKDDVKGDELQFTPPESYSGNNHLEDVEMADDARPETS